MESDWREAASNEMPVQVVHKGQCSGSILGFTLHILDLVYAAQLANFMSASNSSILLFQCKNLKCSHHKYVIGQNVYINNHFLSGNNMKPAWKGHYPIVQVHSNGTVTI